MKVSTWRPILASARGTTESRLAVRLVISMANGALILYHGCHNNTDDSDFSDSIAFVRTPDVALCHHSSRRFQRGDH